MSSWCANSVSPATKSWPWGAIASGGVRVLNGEVVEGLNIPERTIKAVAAKEERELERRERAYRDDRPAPEVQGRTVILQLKERTPASPSRRPHI